jgi:hypothetical protein
MEARLVQGHRNGVQLINMKMNATRQKYVKEVCYYLHTRDNLFMLPKTNVLVNRCEIETPPSMHSYSRYLVNLLLCVAMFVQKVNLNVNLDFCTECVSSCLY